MSARKKIDEYLRPVLTEAGRAPIHDLLDEHDRELAEEMILAISNPANRTGLGWESAVEVIRSIYGIREEGK